MPAFFRPLLCAAILASVLYPAAGPQAAARAASVTANQAGVSGTGFYRSLSQDGPGAVQPSQGVTAAPGAYAPTGPSGFYQSLAQPVPGASTAVPVSPYAVAPAPAPYGVTAASPFPGLPGQSPVYVVDGGGLTVLGPGQLRDPIYQSPSPVAPAPAPLAGTTAPSPVPIPAGPPPPAATAPPVVEPPPQPPVSPDPRPAPRAASAPAEEAPRGGGVSEVRFGVLAHDVAISQGDESGASVNPEILFTSPAFLESLGSPRPHFGASVNTEGDTNQLYAGLTWDYVPLEWIFLEGAVGGALHDGNRSSSSQQADGNNYGCSAGFHFQTGLGVFLGEHFTLAAVTQYMTNFSLCSENDTLFNAGARLGYRF